MYLQNKNTENRPVVAKGVGGGLQWEAGSVEANHCIQNGKTSRPY